MNGNTSNYNMLLGFRHEKVLSNAGLLVFTKQSQGYFWLHTYINNCILLFLHLLLQRFLFLLLPPSLLLLLLQLFLLSLPPSPSLSVNTMVSIDVLVRYLLLFVYMMLSVLNQIVQDMGHVTWVHVHVTNHGWDQYVMC